MNKKSRVVAASFVAMAIGSVAAGVYDVRDFGAKGDGLAKDTAAIQAAIDKATAAGGGTVELPAGTYVSGTIWLKRKANSLSYQPNKKGVF